VCVLSLTHTEGVDSQGAATAHCDGQCQFFLLVICTSQFRGTPPKFNLDRRQPTNCAHAFDSPETSPLFLLKGNHTSCCTTRGSARPCIKNSNAASLPTLISHTSSLATIVSSVCRLIIKEGTEIIPRLPFLRDTQMSPMMPFLSYLTSRVTT